MPAGRRIYYLTPDDNRPIGGIRVIYNHVDILRRHGHDAAVLHAQPGFRATWFDNTVPVAYLPNTLVSKSDMVVFPDVYAHDVPARFPGVRKVIFNQGYFLTFAGEHFDAAPAQSPYRHRDVAAIMVNSQAAHEFIAHALPGAPLVRVSVSIDPALFHFQREKKRQVAFMSRRNPQDLLLILNTLKHRGIVGGSSGVGFTLIENLPQAQVAATLRDSLFFLGVGAQEGFAMPPAEAMACGCLTVGYHGFGGREYMTPDLAYPIAPADALAAARSLEQVIAEYARNPEPLDARRARAAQFIAENYSPAREDQSVIAAWQQIINPTTPPDLQLSINT